MDLVNQQVNCATFADDDLSAFVMPDQNVSFKQSIVQEFVKLKDPSVQLGFDRLARLQ
jgi:hypothetical protein